MSRLFLNGKPTAYELAGAPLAGGIRIAKLKGSLDDLRIYDRPLAAAEVGTLATEEPARAVLFEAASRRTKEQKARLREYFLEHAAPEAMRKTWAELTTLEADRKALNKQIPTVMVMSEAEKPRDTWILGRGDYRNHLEKVGPGTPAMLPPLPKDKPLNRLTLAEWLVDPSHPLTARVAVNRYWQMFSVQGL